MKTASLIVFLAFLTVPTLLLVFFATSSILVRGVNGVEVLSRTSAPLKRLAARRKLYYSILLSYMLLFLASTVWVAYAYSDVAVTASGLSLSQLITIGAIWAIWLAGVSIWSIARAQRVWREIPPPETGSSEQEFSEWQNKRRNATVDVLSQNLLRNLSIVWITGILAVGFSFFIVFFLR